MKQDPLLSKKLRQLVLELKEWADRAEKRGLSRADVERMKYEAAQLEQIMSNREI